MVQLTAHVCGHSPTKTWGYVCLSTGLFGWPCLMMALSNDFLTSCVVEIHEES